MIYKLATTLQDCRQEFRDILEWNRLEMMPLREQELSSIRKRIAQIDEALLLGDTND
jgi:hypothetical protein